MSFDIFAMHLPEGLTSLDDLDPEWSGRPVGSREEIVAAILRAVPEAEIDDDVMTIEGEGFSIQTFLDDDGPMDSVAFHLRGGGGEAVQTVAAILRELGCGAVYAGEGSGIFSEDLAQGAFEEWQDYRDDVLKAAGD